MRHLSHLPDGRNFPPGVGAVGAVLRAHMSLPLAVKLRRVVGSACLFRVLRSAPSPPAQTSLQERQKRYCAGAAVAPLPVLKCSFPSAILSRSQKTCWINVTMSTCKNNVYLIDSNVTLILSSDIEWTVVKLLRCNICGAVTNSWFLLSNTPHQISVSMSHCWNDCFEFLHYK